MNARASDHSEHLDEVVLAYLEACQQGSLLDRHRFLEEHPEFRDELQQFFASQDCLEQAAAPLVNFARSVFPTRLVDARALSGESAVLKPKRARLPDPLPPANSGVSSGDDEVGQLGDFRLRREIGRGGMGVVYEALQISLGRKVALKILPFAAALDSTQLARFKTEAQAAALLHHPNIVPVYSIGCERGVHYYAMQFINGQSLASLLEEWRRQASSRSNGERGQARSEVAASGSGSAPTTQVGNAVDAVTQFSTERSARSRRFFQRVAELGMKAARALDHAHQQGVVHRDIKPANLLLDESGNLWITDFGLALLQSETSITRTGELIGTLRYMSPEQAGGRRGLVDHRTDIYSLGVTLWEALTLRPLFPGQDRHRLLHQILNEEPPSLRSLDRSVPVELETILLKAIEKNPVDRYPTAGELADDLARFLEDKPILAQRPSLWDIGAKWARRHKPAVVSAIVLLVLALAGLTAATVLIARERALTNAAYERERVKAQEAEQSFQQARRAVDLFVHICEDAPDDNPGAQRVRRQILETALVYLQDFLEQRGKDPSASAELTASRDNVERILNQLSRFHGAGQLLLLANDQVQQDLKLSDEQVQQVKDLCQSLFRQRDAAFQHFAQLSLDEQRAQFKELAAQCEAGVARILTERQRHRLGQIALQQFPLSAFDKPEVAGRLHLTSQQRQQILVIRNAISRALLEYWQLGDRSRERRPREEVSRRALQEVLDLLTAQQKAEWQAIIGEPFHGHLGPHDSRPPG